MRQGPFKIVPAIFVGAALLIALQAVAGIRASFGLDGNAWYATHILLVETTGTDGVFTVREVWKGDLALGSSINIPELVPDPKTHPDRKTRPFGPGTDEFGVDEKIPKQPSGSKIVLFLRHRSASDVQATRSGKQHEWQPARDFGGMKVSTAWIKGDKIFCFVQWMNPGPSAFSPCPNFRVQGALTLGSLRQRVNEILNLQNNFSKALAMENNGVRAEALRKIVFSDVYEARVEAIQSLGKCGSEALPILRQIMDKPPVPYDSRDVFAAFVEAAGGDAGRELNEWLEKDAAFWRAQGPMLKEGWWNQDSTPDAPLRLKYDETIQIIRCLDKLHYGPAADTAADLRDFWRSHPALNDQGGLNQMANEAGALVKHLDNARKN